ncbi:MAG: hypothetical protein E7266_09015 [Lachnospiraceae bacterium]|nr:hypothetical protein [Lachnospiraceae bacterium]
MIRPVEIQGVVQRSQDISTMRQGENVKSAVEQANINIQQNKNIQQKSEQVNKQKESDNNQKRFDAREKGSNEYESSGNNNRKNKQQFDDNSDGRVIIKSTTRFDARV